MKNAYICDAVRTPIGRYGGSLSAVRTDDLGAIPIKALMERNPSVNWEKVDDVMYGNANQAGEDNRNVARMSALLAGLPESVGGATINRLCGSGMDATASIARRARGHYFRNCVWSQGGAKFGVPANRYPCPPAHAPCRTRCVPPAP